MDRVVNFVGVISSRAIAPSRLMVPTRPYKADNIMLMCCTRPLFASGGALKHKHDTELRPDNLVAVFKRLSGFAICVLLIYRFFLL